MYKIKLQKHARGMGRFDEIIEIEDRWEAHCKYVSYFKKPYFSGKLVEIVNGREENRASFCNSNYAKPNEN